MGDSTQETKVDPDLLPVKVPLSAILDALRLQRGMLVNLRKNHLKRKNGPAADGCLLEIHDIDAKIALLEAGPKNQSFLIPLREARLWGFGLMGNGRWPKL